jgi:hypothetical protein
VSSDRLFDTDDRGRPRLRRSCSWVAGQLRRYTSVKLTLVVFAVSFCGSAWARPAILPPACAAAMTRSLPGWQFIDVPPDAKKWAKQRRFNPTVARGDFDADGHADHAALVRVGGVPHLAVCIARGRAVKLLVVNDPYCSDLVFRSKAGKRYYNFETARQETLPRDGASVSCFEKAGATYVYDRGALRRIIDSD